MADHSSLSGRLWRFVTIAGLVAGLGILLGKQEKVSAIGKPTTPPSLEALAAGHEVKDIDVRAVVYILISLGAMIGLVFGISVVTVWRFNVHDSRMWSRLTPVQTARLIPAAPHLQIQPFADLAHVRAHEERLLHSYGWTSADHSTARIPIGRAMALVVGKSLDTAP